MRKLLPVLSLALLLSGCGGTSAPSATPDSAPPTRVTPPEVTIPDTQPEPEPSSEEQSNPDRVLSSLTALVSGGRTLRLDAIGDFQANRKDHCGIREVQVYEAGAVVQTVRAGEAPLSDSGSEYTEAAAVDGAMAVRDMNFDGYDDLELADWSSSGTNPHHFWLWDASTGRFTYAFTLRGAAADPDTRQITASYNDSGKEYLDTYQYTGPSSLTQISRRTEDWKNGTEDFPLVEIYSYQGGVETLLRQEFTDYNNDGVAMREVRMLVDGVLTPVLMERLDYVDGELRVVETTPVEPPAPENPDGIQDDVPYPWEEYLDPGIDGEYPAEEMPEDVLPEDVLPENELTMDETPAG